MFLTASLTEYGQRLIARLIKNKISIADYFRTMGKFSLSDDEVVYGVFVPTISLIRQTKEESSIYNSNYRLVTLFETDPGDRRDFMPMIVNVNLLYETQYPNEIIIEPNTAYGINKSYTLYIQPNIFVLNEDLSDVDHYPDPAGSVFVAVGRRFALKAKPFFANTSVINARGVVLGNDEGGVWIFNIRVTPTELQLYSFRFPPQFVGIENIFILTANYDAASTQQSGETYYLNTF